ncbi:MAG: hypothetical protein MSA07_06460 [Mucispirillum sp.]|nr:hypothetical protein [Mucispirillum sp.]
MNITNIIYLILIALIIALSITIAVKSNQIKVLEAEKQALNMQIAQAESSIKLQNAKIEEMAINQETAESMYNENMKALQDKYKNLDNLSSQDKTCNEILDIINQNQKEFLAGGLR